MPIGGVIGDQVEDYPDATAASLANQSFECGEVAQFGMDPTVIAHIVAPIFERRGIDGSEPNRIDTQRSIGTIIQVVQVRGDAIEVADAVTVRIGKAAHVDLIENRAAPPFRGHLSCRSSFAYERFARQ